MNPLIEHFGSTRCWLLSNADKAPCDRHGRPLRNWQNTGATYAQALQFVDHKRVHGLGIRVDAAPRLVALDLDDCLNKHGGIVDDLALLPLLDAPTYCEITWSGNSIRAYYILADEHASVHRCEKDDPHEVYFKTAKFVIVTGNAYYPLRNHKPVTELATITPVQLDKWLAMFDRRRVYSADEELAQLREIHAITHDAETAQAIREIEAGIEAARVAQQVRSFAPAALPRGGGLVALREHVAAQREGNRNSALFWAACRAAERGMHEHEISELLADAARSTGLRDREIAATIRSATRRATR
ncbi:MAG: primase C-terminal domain-containing protein [Candidatus Brachytrichaceae bacterium NZ_4S206]|jgi:hypothetical protein